ncbi:hypothetical protein PVT68_12610 [Microbulbifer bruguierae]|uniref:DUF1585 domain-containing protein n=1 Tax=Microbulbifer bruguierae TaxID=3029061 RepID=A0ABY8NAE7_9GAMM|nr:hypothetical protein [Microbulbifer bruguierae]WGL15610.1 hypothetical protein PVT68_12610 [Microbulbifer bruguierae]
MKIKTSAARLLLVATACAGTSLAVPAIAGPGEQAAQIHSRLTGVKPDTAVLTTMAEEIANGNAEAAAYLAMDNDAFYNVTLRNLVTPWTSRDFDNFAPLNDYTATVIGMVRDDVDFREVLSGDILYTGAASGLDLPAYSNSNNNHYIALEKSGYPLQAALERTTQSTVTGLPSDATAGVITTRGGARAFFYAGTNRAMFRYTLMNHLCRDLEQVQDTSRPPDRIRQDVSRSPGGDSRVFQNGCVGCHSGMDPLAQAFAYYDFVYDADNDPTGENGQLDYNSPGQTDPATGTRVKAKHHINSATFPYGFVIPDDKWDNYWREGPNMHLGWSDALPGSGNGAKSMGRELANSEAFAQCQVTKVFEQVCLRSPENQQDRDQIESITDSFTSTGYRLKQVYADSAVYCAEE